MSRMSESAKLRRERRQREGWPVDRRVGSLNHGLRYMQALGGWALPLPTIDPQIVRRRAAALDRYGPDFRYGHVLSEERRVGKGGVSMCNIRWARCHQKKK